MEELILKYNRLNSFSQKQVMDFLDFLLGKQSKKQPQFDFKNYQQKLLQVSTWSESDIEEMKSNVINIEPREW